MSHIERYDVFNTVLPLEIGYVGERPPLHGNRLTFLVQPGVAVKIVVHQVEQIRQLVNVQLPGIAVRALPVAPRQLPYQSGFVYFELDRSSEFWAKLESSGGFAMHLSGEFPGIRMEFWAIRG